MVYDNFHSWTQGQETTESSPKTFSAPAARQAAADKETRLSEPSVAAEEKKRSDIKCDAEPTPLSNLNDLKPGKVKCTAKKSFFEHGA